MNRQIEVWYDDNDAVWCVSLCDGDGQEVEFTRSTHNQKDDAIEAGRKAAREAELRLCERSKYGPVTELASADEMRMQAVLLRHGSRFSGNSVEDEAWNWADQGFDPDEADDWCEIGVWNAATAAEFRDAGLTPEKVEAAAESLTEGLYLDDCADKYTDGDPIYAACNGDIGASVIIEAAE